MCRLSERDLEVLQAAQESDLAKWWCQLNSWIWPKEIPNKPRDYSATLRDVSPTMRRAWAIMGWIMSKVGRPVIVEEWQRNFI